MSKPITIPIRKHTKVRRPVSSWHISLVDGERYIHYFTNDRYDALYQDAFHKPKPIVVQDIKTGLDPQILCHDGLYGKANVQKIQKGDWNEWHKQVSEDIMFMDVPNDVRDEINKNPDGYQPKPSLLTKLKNRFKK